MPTCVSSSGAGRNLAADEASVIAPPNGLSMALAARWCESSAEHNGQQQSLSIRGFSYRPMKLPPTCVGQQVPLTGMHDLGALIFSPAGRRCQPGGPPVLPDLFRATIMADDGVRDPADALTGGATVRLSDVSRVTMRGVDVRGRVEPLVRSLRQARRPT